MESGGPCLSQAVQVVGHPCSESVCKQAYTQDTIILQHGSIKQESKQWRCFKEVAREAKVFLPITKHHPTGLRETSQMGDPDHDHAILARPELVPRNNVASNRTTEVVSAIRVVSIEFKKPGRQSQRSWGIFSWLPGGLHHHLCLEWHKKGNFQEGHWLPDKRNEVELPMDVWAMMFFLLWELPVLKVCVRNLVNYLNFWQVTHNYAYTMLCIHVSAICSIPQPTEQMRASTAPLVRQLLNGGSWKNLPVTGLTDSWDIRKVIDLL